MLARTSGFKKSMIRVGRRANEPKHTAAQLAVNQIVEARFRYVYNVIDCMEGDWLMIPKAS